MDIKLGPRIASLRRAKSMTQEQLALSLGVSPPAAVSYTHLDVYKRQMFYRTMIPDPCQVGKPKT